MDNHRTCLAQSCQAKIKKSKLFCKSHWAMMPEDIREEIMKSYPIGCLKDSSKVTAEFKSNLTAARRAIRNVERAQGWGEVDPL